MIQNLLNKTTQTMKKLRKGMKLSRPPCLTPPPPAQQEEVEGTPLVRTPVKCGNILRSSLGAVEGVYTVVHTSKVTYVCPLKRLWFSVRF